MIPVRIIATTPRAAYHWCNVIDGYTVPEAASVLGVPEGRVWELLARGVISGTPEGDSMRVHLRARSEPPVAAQQPGPKSNGNGGSNGGSEASAFRELLTEFRNLTERYGQALLALGEARGEVAGLRSRIELLESRLDLRLPGPAAPAAVAWTASEPVATPPTAAPSAPAAKEPVAPVAPPRPPKARARKGRSGPTTAPRRSAVAGIAAALARAQDPSAAELPQRAAQPDASPPVAEPAPPSEVPEAPAASAYTTEVVEPDWFADGDFAWLDAAEHAALEPPSEAPAPAAEAEAEAEEAGDVAGAEEALTESEAEVVAEELAVAELESAPRGYAEPIAQVVPEEPAPAPLTLTEEELARLAADEGWGASEVEAIRSLIGSERTPATIELPGSTELDAAMAALEATPATAPEDQWSKAWPEADPISIPVQPPTPDVPPAPPPRPAAARQAQPAARTTSTEPPWLRRRRGPAATAFRTLRRLFPG